ncbi:hypothetical protein Hanom_Chr07g00601521 [Helianthus anomalus]
MSPRVRTRHGEVTAELAWSGSCTRSEITLAVGRTVHYPPPPQNTCVVQRFYGLMAPLKLAGPKPT